jgi:hypothetical protein
MSGTGVSSRYLTNLFSSITNVHHFPQREDFSKWNTLKKLLRIPGKFL